MGRVAILILIGIFSGCVSFPPMTATVGREDLDRPPRVLNSPSPSYPLATDYPHGWPSKAPAEAVIGLIIEADGRVTEVTVIRTSDAEFAKHAAETAKTWRFEAPTMRGKPVRVRMEVPFIANQPNKAPEPTTTAVTRRAYERTEVFQRDNRARRAPAVVVAHL